CAWHSSQACSPKSLEEPFGASDRDRFLRRARTRSPTDRRRRSWSPHFSGCSSNKRNLEAPSFLFTASHPRPAVDESSDTHGQVESIPWSAMQSGPLTASAPSPMDSEVAEARDRL